MSPILDVDNDRVRKLFDVNVIAPISVAKAFTPLLIAAKGTIVNVGSYVDNLAVPWQGIYNASKAALRAVTDNLRLEIRPFNVNVVYVRLPYFWLLLIQVPNRIIDRGRRN